MARLSSAGPAALEAKHAATANPHLLSRRHVISVRNLWQTGLVHGNKPVIDGCTMACRSRSEVQGRQLDQQDNWTFWRFNIEVAMTGEEQAVVYAVDIHDPSFPPERSA